MRDLVGGYLITNEILFQQKLKANWKTGGAHVLCHSGGTCGANFLFDHTWFTGSPSFSSGTHSLSLSNGALVAGGLDGTNCSGATSIVLALPTAGGTGQLCMNATISGGVWTCTSGGTLTLQ